jgi:tRNA uridine 5-carboxymethylaminomethyl modification enzyme
MSKWDVIVIGGGHAGAEAAHAAARMGQKTALVTLNPGRIGFMSCNPAIGGLAKGQLVKEIDALGGIMGVNTDKTAIQYRRLNASKGPAVRSSRAQCDKRLYALRMQEFLGQVPNLTLVGGEVAGLLTQGRRVTGLELSDGTRMEAGAVVVTAGTFMRAVMFTGSNQTEGGRAGDQSALGLSGSLEKMGFRLGRLKTGTPPRLHRRSIDFSKLEAQPGDEKPIPFSFFFRPERFPLLPQVNCFMTYTNEQTHQIIEENFGRSPMFTGLIQGVGPRYCPSIEDKVKRFRDRERHQLFLEPEGLECDEIYVNGISTSLPSDVQERFVHSIAGLEKAEFLRFGYAVEYDCVDARMLKATFESKDWDGLFFAGQVNGTSGYEEAGAQGLIAGINAAHLNRGADPFRLLRSDAYIGVLVDDLVTKGADEPYRMFTSRAEHRLLLREDNADLRLSEMGYKLGLLSAESHDQVLRRKEAVERGLAELNERQFYPKEETNAELVSRGLAPLRDRVSAEVLLRRPEINWQTLCELGFDGLGYDESVQEQLEIQVKYKGYIQRDLDILEGLRKHEGLEIPVSVDFGLVPGISTEIRTRFKTARPETIGQASRLAGVTPAALASLMIYLRMNPNGAVGLGETR